MVTGEHSSGTAVTQVPYLSTDASAYHRSKDWILRSLWRGISREIVRQDLPDERADGGEGVLSVVPPSGLGFLPVNSVNTTATFSACAIFAMSLRSDFSERRWVGDTENVGHPRAQTDAR